MRFKSNIQKQFAFDVSWALILEHRLMAPNRAQLSFYYYNLFIVCEYVCVQHGLLRMRTQFRLQNNLRLTSFSYGKIRCLFAKKNSISFHWNENACVWQFIYRVRCHQLQNSGSITFFQSQWNNIFLLFCYFGIYDHKLLETINLCVFIAQLFCVFFEFYCKWIRHEKKKR